jgi:hypothetical protein
MRTKNKTDVCSHGRKGEEVNAKQEQYSDQQRGGNTSID